MDKKKPKSRIMLVDDHPLLRHGIAELVNGESNLEVCGEAGNMQDAFTLAGKLKPDLVIVDFAMGLLNGLQVGTRLSKTLPDLPIILHSVYGLRRPPHSCTMSYWLGCQGLYPR